MFCGVFSDRDKALKRMNDLSIEKKVDKEWFSLNEAILNRPEGGLIEEMCILLREQLDMERIHLLI
jgi:hypothetical protein